VMLGDANEPARGVEPVVALPQRRFVDGVARLLLDRMRKRLRGELLDLLVVVALRDQLRLGAEHVVEAVIRVLDRARAAANAELLRRHAFDAGALARAADLDGDVVQLGARRDLIPFVPAKAGTQSPGLWPLGPRLRGDERRRRRRSLPLRTLHDLDTRLRSAHRP